MALFGGSYMGIYALVHRRLGEVDRVQMQAKEQRYRCTSEALGGIKDIKLMGSEHVFLDAFSISSLVLTEANRVSTVCKYKNIMFFAI